MSRYDGLIIPRSYSEYINKTDAATLSQALQLNNALDDTPTEDSRGGVRSGGVFDALAGKQPTLTFDNVPTEDSANPVKSGGIYDALATKQNTLTFDDEPTAGSNNPVKSDGIKTYVDQTYSKVNIGNSTTLTTTESVIILTESLANIKTLEITVGAAGIVRGSLIIPIGAFRAVGYKAIVIGYIGGNVHAVVMEYVDDTHIKAYTTEAKNLNVVYIRGLIIR